MVRYGEYLHTKRQLDSLLDELDLDDSGSLDTGELVDFLGA